MKMNNNMWLNRDIAFTGITGNLPTDICNTSFYYMFVVPLDFWTEHEHWWIDEIFSEQKLDKYKPDTSRNIKLHVLHIGMFLFREQGRLHSGTCGNLCRSNMRCSAYFWRHGYALAQVCKSHTSTTGLQWQHPRGHHHALCWHRITTSSGTPSTTMKKQSQNIYPMRIEQGTSKKEQNIKRQQKKCYTSILTVLVRS